MARRRPPEEDDVSLFPFLSIIAAVIGVLTLMIAAVTLGQMNQEDVKAAVANAIEMEQVQLQLMEQQAEIESLRLKLGKEQADLLRNAESRQQELVKTRAELDDLLKQLAAEKRKLEERKKIQIVIPAVPKDQRETMADVQAKLDETKKRLATLQKVLDDRKQTKEAEVSVLPGGTGLSFKPLFVECAAGSIVLHTEQPPLRIRAEQMGAHQAFVKLLERAANSNNFSVTFLIRSDGLATYRAAKRLCDSNHVRNGKLPAVGDGRLDFSHFR